MSYFTDAEAQDKIGKRVMVKHPQREGTLTGTVVSKRIAIVLYEVGIEWDDEPGRAHYAVDYVGKPGYRGLILEEYTPEKIS